MPTPARARALLLATILALAPALAAEPLDPASYARLVLTEHPSLASSRAALSAALAREQTAADWPDPQVRLELAPASLTGMDAGYALMVDQALPQPVARRAAREASRLSASAASLDQEAAVNALYEDAVNAWLDRWLAEQALASIQSQLDLVLSWQRSAEASLAAGMGSADEALMAADEALSMRFEARMWAARADAAGQVMNLLLSLPPDAPLVPLAPLGDAELPAGEATSAPDLLADRARAEAMAADAEGMLGMRRPMVGLGAGYSSMAMTPAHRATVSVMLSVPIGSGGRGAIDEARASASAMSANADAMVIEREVMLARASADLGAMNRTLAQLESELLPLRQQRLNLAISGYAAGRTMLADALKASAQLRAAELQIALTRADAWRMSAELSALLGVASAREGVTP